ncbi:hypothetical protein GXW83_01945 [Streptacidiphilus sp. PB12-B1b]|uniref:hypothetical protein n=1 Tax=Streptacidiphilus sp. PB12-B1b TaxID=2705012 RepID=UPI0015FA880B|nr:hypothetical protein [Streptacidiphilus sp. PB12-B1b]QMU74724.1 hypothetical protein GXW83_01945 [Streptacidiphilus sp. PB12-B1b]
MPLTGSDAADPRTQDLPVPASDSGPEGNERLTASTGGVLLVLFAAEGVTILSLSRLLTWHYFFGFMLIGPVLLKLGSTLYRFTRYYSGAPDYRRKGPPMPLLRVLGPFVVITSVTVIGTGVALGLLGTDDKIGPFPLLLLHKASFVAWAAVMTVHVLAYVWRLPRLIGADLSRRPARHGEPQPGRAGARWSLLAGSLAIGLTIALLGTPLASKWRGADHHGHHRVHVGAQHQAG